MRSILRQAGVGLVVAVAVHDGLRRGCLGSQSIGRR